MLGRRISQRIAPRCKRLSGLWVDQLELRTPLATTVAAADFAKNAGFHRPNRSGTCPEAAAISGDGRSGFERRGPFVFRRHSGYQAA